FGGRVVGLCTRVRRVIHVHLFRGGVRRVFGVPYAAVRGGSCHPVLLGNRIFSTARTLAEAARGFSAISCSVGLSVPVVHTSTTGACSSSSTGKLGGVRLVACA